MKSTGNGGMQINLTGAQVKTGLSMMAKYGADGAKAGAKAFNEYNNKEQ